MNKYSHLGLIIMENTSLDREDANHIAESPYFWDIDDEVWEENGFADVEMNTKNILEFYRKNPMEIYEVIDEIQYESDKLSFNWRYHITGII